MPRPPASCRIRNPKRFGYLLADALNVKRPGGPESQGISIRAAARLIDAVVGAERGISVPALSAILSGRRDRVSADTFDALMWTLAFQREDAMRPYEMTGRDYRRAKELFEDAGLHLELEESNLRAFGRKAPEQARAAVARAKELLRLRARDMRDAAKVYRRLLLARESRVAAVARAYQAVDLYLTMPSEKGLEAARARRKS